jgi:hypothetical protein
MRPMTVILSLALSGFVLSSDFTTGSFTTASANKMNGKCCASSDGGRWDRYRTAVWRAEHQHPRTCTAYAASCFRWSSERAYDPQVCQAAKAACVRTGVYAGPYSGRQFFGLQKS